jgi:GntR family transcriptional repressor for pyruvate dehydrogenase complex
MLAGMTTDALGTTSAPTPVHVPKAAELVAEALRARILRRQLLPGDRLPAESALMEQFGVSRPTLREALRLLEAQELLEVRRGARGGGVVRQPSTRPAIEAITLWLLLSQPEVTRVPEDQLAAIAATALELATAALPRHRRRRAA